jgi:hypothetical protein
MTSPKWKQFENLVYEIQKSLAPEAATVILDDKITGQDSKVARQIDISIRMHIANYDILIVIDCKDYKEPVDVKDIGEFASLAHDVRANKGAVVSGSGFTAAAIQMASTSGIDTLQLVDTESMDRHGSCPVR